MRWFKKHKIKYGDLEVRLEQFKEGEITHYKFCQYKVEYEENFGRNSEYKRIERDCREFIRGRH